MRISDWSSDVCSSDLPNQGTANEDGSNGTTITGPNSASFTYTAGPPFADNFSDTLADVAMKYWKNDLRTDADMPNIVPTSAADPDRKSVVSGKSVSVRVFSCGRSFI